MENVSWVSLARALVREKWSVGQKFNLGEVYDQLQMFEDAYPQNHHPKDKIRQVMQSLRDEGTLEFVDNEGQYRRLR